MEPGRNDPCPCGSGKKYKKCCYLAKPSAFFKDIISEDIEDDDDVYDENNEDDGGDDYDVKPSLLYNALYNLRKRVLSKKPHIKEYHKNRKMHKEIISAMVQYYQDGKYERQADPNFSPVPEHGGKTIYVQESGFDLKTQLGAHGFYDMWIYKTALNVMCITDDFIRKHRYRNPEKIEFLHSMLNSKLGLFEVTGTDEDEGYAYIKDVFTGTEYTIVDIALSGNRNNNAYYLYTRIISHKGICFGSGLNFIFAKTDRFIKNHIQQHKKDFHPNGEFQRFIQLYNHYSQNSKRIRAVGHEY